VHDIHKLSSYLLENTSPFRYQDESVEGKNENNLQILRKK